MSLCHLFTLLNLATTSASCYTLFLFTLPHSVINSFSFLFGKLPYAFSLFSACRYTTSILFSYTTSILFFVIPLYLSSLPCQCTFLRFPFRLTVIPPSLLFTCHLSICISECRYNTFLSPLLTCRHIPSSLSFSTTLSYHLSVSRSAWREGNKGSG